MKEFLKKHIGAIILLLILAILPFHGYCEKKYDENYERVFQENLDKQRVKEGKSGGIILDVDVNIVEDTIGLRKNEIHEMPFKVILNDRSIYDSTNGDILKESKIKLHGNDDEVLHLSASSGSNSNYLTDDFPPSYNGTVTFPLCIMEYIEEDGYEFEFENCYEISVSMHLY